MRENAAFIPTPEHTVLPELRESKHEGELVWYSAPAAHQNP